MAGVVYLALFVIFVLLEIGNIRGTLHGTLMALTAKG